MIAGEAMLFLTSCLLGAALGVVYDFFRTLRLLIPTGSGLAFIEDGVFFACAGAAEFIFFLNHTYGQLRVFLLAGQGLGFMVYYLTAGRAVHCVMLRLSKIIRAIIRRIAAGGGWIINKIFRKISNKTVQTDENIQKGSTAEKFT